MRSWLRLTAGYGRGTPPPGLGSASVWSNSYHLRATVPVPQVEQPHSGTAVPAHQPGSRSRGPGIQPQRDCPGQGGLGPAEAGEVGEAVAPILRPRRWGRLGLWVVWGGEHSPGADLGFPPIPPRRCLPFRCPGGEPKTEEWVVSCLIYRG